MSVRVEIDDRQRAARIGRRALRAAVPRLLEQAAGPRPATWHTVTLILLDDEGIRAVNRRVFARDTVTDVITQALRPQPGGPAGWLGDVYVNVQRALALGAARAGGPARELLLYVAHGCDHLQGGLDDTPRQRAAMLRREARWIRAMPPPLVQPRRKADRP